MEYKEFEKACDEAQAALVKLKYAWLAMHLCYAADTSSAYLEARGEYLRCHDEVLRVMPRTLSD